MCRRQNVSGVNAYALMNSPRASGSETIVVSASWLSEVGEGPYNLRGIATVLALAGFLKSTRIPVLPWVVV
jgi:glycosylphosphatidylinositol transamidase